MGSRDQTAKVYFNDGTGAFEYRTKLGESYDTGPSAVGVIDAFVTGSPDGYPCPSASASASPAPSPSPSPLAAPSTSPSTSTSPYS